MGAILTGLGIGFVIVAVVAAELGKIFAWLLAPVPLGFAAEVGKLTSQLISSMGQKGLEAGVTRPRPMK